MSALFPQYGYILLLAISEIFGDFALEKYANTGVSGALGAGLVGYAGVVFFLVQALRGSSILYVNGMWDGTSALVESLAAFFLLGERFVRWEQYMGLGLIVVGIGLLARRRGEIMQSPWRR